MGRELIAALAISISLGACGARAPQDTAHADAERAHPTERAEAPTEMEDRPARVRVRVIRVFFEGRTPEQARDRAQMLARTARADDFSALAAQYGDGERASEIGAGGVVIEADSAQYPGHVRDIALGLDVHEVSRAIESDDGFWVLERAE